jgi:hypothetical protein
MMVLLSWIIGEKTYTASNSATFRVEVKDSLSSGQNPIIYIYIMEIQGLPIQVVLQTPSSE